MPPHSQMISRDRILVGNAWSPTMEDRPVPSPLLEGDAELEHYNVVTFQEAEASSRPTTPESWVTISSTDPSSPALSRTPTIAENLAGTLTVSDKSSDYDEHTQSAPGSPSEGHGDDNNEKPGGHKLPQEADMTEAETTHSELADPAVASVYGLLLPKKCLQERLTAAISRGTEIESAVEATKMAHQAINEKQLFETKLAEALKKQHELQRALNREQGERRVAVMAAKELKHTNTSLSVMVGELQAQCINLYQQDIATCSPPAQCPTSTKERTPQPTPAAVFWLEELWQSIGHEHPQLAIAEKLWKDKLPQLALNKLLPLLDLRQDVAVERGQIPPLSDLSMLANLMKAAIQLAARQRETALLGFQWILHEARGLGRVGVERRAQWLRGHAYLALERPREARACFGMCASEELPREKLQKMRKCADAAIANLHKDHPGRRISEDFVQFYYQWVS